MRVQGFGQRRIGPYLLSLKFLGLKIQSYWSQWVLWLNFPECHTRVLMRILIGEVNSPLAFSAWNNQWTSRVWLSSAWVSVLNVPVDLSEHVWYILSSYVSPTSCWPPNKCYLPRLFGQQHLNMNPSGEHALLHQAVWDRDDFQVSQAWHGPEIQGLM